MKIHWLNGERSIARVSRGIWPWRKIAIVERVGYEKWRHIDTGDIAEDWLARGLEWAAISAAVDAKRAEHERRNWSRRRTLPRAEVR